MLAIASSPVPFGRTRMVTWARSPGLSIAAAPNADAAAGASRRVRITMFRARMAERTFVKFTFFKMDPAWRRREATERAADKREFLAACEDFSEDRSLRAYST